MSEKSAQSRGRRRMWKGERELCLAECYALLRLMAFFFIPLAAYLVVFQEVKAAGGQVFAGNSYA